MKTTQGAGRRALRAAAMGAGVTGSYLGYAVQRAFLSEAGRSRKLKDAHASAARRLTSGMVDMRGPVMKLGQTLSLHTDLLPEVMIGELSKLQMQAPGMHPSLVRAQFRSSMGRDPEEMFRQFKPEPFAAASLGQVHHAVLRSGEPAAVKIQYPGIRSAIESDFKWFRVLSKPAQLLRYLPTDAVDELQEQIVAECDYRREADNIRQFSKALSPLAWVEVPNVHARLSGDRVLTMSMVPGRHLEAFLATRPSQKLRDLVGARLLELYWFQFLQMEALHADPHWGNYLIRDDGSIGLIDFGCVRYFPHEFVTSMRKALLYQGVGDAAFQKVIEDYYVRKNRKPTPAVRKALVSISVNFFGKVYPPSPETDGKAFDFGDGNFLKEYLRELAGINRARASLPEYVFLSRAESGLYQTLHRLKARVHTSAIVRKYL